MTPENALSRIPGFGRAEVGMTLSDGATSNTILVKHLARRYVLRIDKPAARDLGLHRDKEEEVLRLVAAGGLAPEPLYFDLEHGIFLREFTAGTNWTVSELQNKKALRRLADTLRTLHSLPAVSARFEPGSALQRYANAIDTDEAREIAGRAQSALDKLEAKAHVDCLCHNDLLNHNILESENVNLIDWEFAGMGDPVFDLATVIEHHNLPDKLVQIFLRHYLERLPVEDDMRRLSLQRTVFKCLSELWYLRTSTTHRPSEVIMEE